MSKFLFALGTITILIVPLSSVISCGLANNTYKGKQSLKELEKKFKNIWDSVTDGKFSRKTQLKAIDLPEAEGVGIKTFQYSVLTPVELPKAQRI